MNIPATFFATVFFLAGMASPAIADSLPSWNDTPAKASIIEFVDRVTDPDSPDYVPPAERIATFDNDGNLWAEQPVYFQLMFTIGRIQAMAADHPEWKEEEPYASILKGDLHGALAGDHNELLEMALTAHGNLTAEEFNQAAKNWLTTARHPQTGILYTEMVYQPMLELLTYLRENDFKTFIVSGGGVDFIRAFAEEVYGIPPEQVIGTRLKARYEVQDGKLVIIKEPSLGFIDDKESKPIAIYEQIGRRPIFASGNSDGDFQMLEWTTAGEGPRFGLLLHHTDAEREWAYDRESPIGKLSRGLDEGPGRSWVIVSMQDDWEQIYP